MITNSISGSTIDVNAAARGAAQLNPIGRGGIQSKAPAGAATGNGNVKSFGEVLADAVLRDSGLSFSAHAQKRMASRGIRLNASEISRLGAAREKLAGKGAKEALVLIDDKAFLVSVKNRTVITALDKNELKQTVFTNIDGAVIA